MQLFLPLHCSRAVLSGSGASVRAANHLAREFYGASATSATSAAAADCGSMLPGTTSAAAAVATEMQGERVAKPPCLLLQQLFEVEGEELLHEMRQVVGRGGT
jgi:hypothetical protein